MQLAAWRAIVADLAVINHWALADIERMPIGELRAYHALAIERTKALLMAGSGKKK